MGDYLVRAGGRPLSRRLLKSLGIQTPQHLERREGPWLAHPLEGCTVVLAGAGPLWAPIRSVIEEAGGTVLDPDRAALETWPKALVFVGTELEQVAELEGLHTFFHHWIRQIQRSGRIVVVGRSRADTPEAAACAQALDGFVRSVAKEVGRKGTTANRITVVPGAEDRLDGPLRWLLSPRSAYVSGQTLALSALLDRSGPPSWERPLEGRTALVTGAARGIGAATALRLGEEGAQVLCVDRPGEDDLLDEVSRAIGGSALACDVTDSNTPERLAEHLADGVHVVVHNAGITRDRTLGKMDPERWKLTLDVNLAAVDRITERLLQGPLQDGGRLVALSSTVGICGNFGQTNYAASKAGLIGWVRARSGPLAERGITVNAIAPGFIETRMTAAIPFFTREGARRLSALFQGGLPQDVAEAITFLASPGADGLSGQVLRVCGGSFMGA